MVGAFLHTPKIVPRGALIFQHAKQGSDRLATFSRAGWSETFSDEGPSKWVIKNKIDEVYAELVVTSSDLGG